MTTDDYETRLGSYACITDKTLDLPPIPERHDIPPHCKPSESGAECCVGSLNGDCRKCGAKGVFCNAPCTVVEERWTARQWHANWDAYGRKR